MDYATREFSVKICASKLRRKKGCEPKTVHPTEPGSATPTDLDPYIYEKLFLPILWTGEVQLKDIDITRITDDDISALYDALRFCNAPTYISLAKIFDALEPAARAAHFI